ncbi:O-acetylhomoserine aminocarboxypropyltransferase/cysteine synthase family protein [Promicromonospora sp. NPDC057138]|uniref:O-acetylhomoserine aminocarboxypropyltransferase/cysteine synthase family protein n=1 Tax=Promicromonospora sp. NPDC057138 TaxID=3346031 RepID=UPI0036440F51
MTGFATRQVHGDAGRDAGASGAPAPGRVTPRATPVYLTAGFEFEEWEQAGGHFGAGEGYAYTRTGNPTTAAVERRIAALEGGADALFVASGQAAVTLALLGLVSAGQRVLAAASLYEGTRGLLLENLPRLGIEADFVDAAADPAAWERAIRPETRVLFLESIPNARNDLPDLAAVADVAHAHGLALVVDNTLATPYLLRPIEHGADVVVHSASKFLAGHGSVLGGVVVDSGTFDPAASGGLYPHLVAPSRTGGPSVPQRHGGRARLAYLRETVAPRFGPTPSPLNAFLVGQGIETLSLRVARQSATALEVARWLAFRPEVASVDYCGLDSSPSYALAKRYLPDGQGSVFTFTLHGGAPAARAFVETVEVVTHMTHIGDVRSLVLHPPTTSHVLRTPAEQAAGGVHPGTLRLSIGVEDLPDLIADLERGLAAAVRAPADIDPEETP